MKTLTFCDWGGRMTLGILALDLATSTGWAFRDRNGVVTSGVQTFDVRRGESPGMRFLRCRRWLAEVLQPSPVRVGDRACSWDVEGDRALVRMSREVDVIAYEKAHHRGGHATACLVGLATVVQEEAARLGIDLAPIATATLKKHATGRGNASKDEMITAALTRWPDRLKLATSVPGQSLGDDEADALCVLSWAIDELEAPVSPTATERAVELKEEDRG